MISFCNYKTLKWKIINNSITNKRGHILIRDKSIFFTFLKLYPESFGGMRLFVKKKNHLIPLENWGIDLKNLYESLDTMGTILNNPIKADIFSLKDIESGIHKLANGKTKDIKRYQAEIFRMGRSILILHLHKLINLAVKHGFPKP